VWTRTAPARAGIRTLVLLTKVDREAAGHAEPGPTPAPDDPGPTLAHPLQPPAHPQPSGQHQLQAHDAFGGGSRVGGDAARRGGGSGGAGGGRVSLGELLHSPRVLGLRRAVSAGVGVPVMHVLPVANYSEVYDWQVRWCAWGRAGPEGRGAKSVSPRVPG
jgi:hypothetical protein